ncbi:telomerase RNA component interacting RNase isoform X2 [Solea solea]|uniref:telomerase RNA component interacting RNase isoform X2 n=1 Tax=Solea solea TaxID=90069 RepID=UPI00272BF74B|nr:telomerase RNA component interacting RNase isoform X2 [Solea solea]
MEPHRAHSKPPASGDGSSSGDSSPASPSSSTAPTASNASVPGGNAFANDGSFMEMFKKKMEEEQKRKKETPQSGDGRATEQGQTSVERKPPPVTSFVGKRRGGVFLKTGVVAKKQKEDSEAVPGKSDAWSKYMAEVKKYKAHQCGDDDKTRPLVK